MDIPSEALAATNPRRISRTGPWASLNEERSEVLECVREAMAANDYGTGRAAACTYLLNHLFETTRSVQ
jgi:hypothetical protein